MHSKFKNIRAKWPADLAVEVFLGGASGSTTWRKNITIPVLNSGSITYFDPIVPNWRPELVVIESIVKERSSILLFVINEETRAVSSLVEAAEYICEGIDVVLVLKDIPAGSTIAGETLQKGELKDLNRGRA
jgi:raw